MIYSKEKQQEIDALPAVPLGRAKDLTNQVFGRLTALKRAPRKNNAAYWWCICSCEQQNIVQVNASHLTCHQTLSCGCLVKEKVSEIGKKASKDLQGKTFGFLTVIKDSGKRAHNRGIIWECRCKCGKTFLARGDSLQLLHTTSCGCRKNSFGEIEIEKILQENNILYKKEFIFSDLKSDKHKYLRFDFAILNEHNEVIRLIEFDGEQHRKEVTGIWGENDSLEERQYRDQLKNEYAKQHKIPLVRIPYSLRNKLNIQMLLKDEYNIL